ARRDAGLEEGEAQAGEARGHATEEERAAHRFLRRGEVPDVVVDVVRRRPAAPPAVPDAVEGRGDAERLAARPEGVVVVEALVPERVDPLPRRAVAVLAARDRAARDEGAQAERRSVL